MTSRSDVERMLDRYLAEGAERVPDRVIDDALRQIDHVPQRRAVRVPWRFQPMPSFFKLALSGAAVIAALVVGGMFLNRAPTDTVGGSPIATPLPSASAPASASPLPSASVVPIDTSAWKPFTSEQYGYSIAYPQSWSAEAATRDWSLEADRTDWKGYEVADRFLGTYDLQTVLVTAFAADVPSGMSDDEWLTAYCESSFQGAGFLPGIMVDGRRGVIAASYACSDAPHVFVFNEGRVHVFAVWRENQQALLEAFLSTVRFQ